MESNGNDLLGRPRRRRRLRRGDDQEYGGRPIGPGRERVSRIADGEGGGLSDDGAFASRTVIAISSSDDDNIVEESAESDAEERVDPTVGGQPTSRTLCLPHEEVDGHTASEARGADKDSPTTCAVQDWACKWCTFINASDRLACEMCLNARPMQRAPRQLSAWLASAPDKSSTAKRMHQRREAAVETIETSSDDEVTTETRQKCASTQVKLDRSTGADARVDLWVDHLCPQTLDELCVQRKKVQEVQDWLVQSAPTSSHAGVRKRLLFLCGPPGAGKSTTLRLLAQSMGWMVKEWRDNSSAGRLNYHRLLQDDVRIHQDSTWDDFVDFIHRSVNYSALPLTTTSSRSKNRQSSSAHHQTNAGQVILVESWPQNPLSTQGIQIDEKLQVAFRHIVNPGARVQHPVVCIFSDVREGKVDPAQLVRLFSVEVVKSDFTSVINFNGVTTAQIKKTLIRALDRTGATMSTPGLQRILNESNGDIRYAVNMLQVFQRRRAQKRTRAKAAADVKPIETDEEASRDPFLSDFHIIGKLLHRKHSDYEVLDRMLHSAPISLDRLLALLHENCPPYFTQIDDLADACELMSLSEAILSRLYQTSSTSQNFTRSQDIVQSVLTRCIHATNRCPAPTTFRPITRPRTFETWQRMESTRRDSLLDPSGKKSTLYCCTGDQSAFEVHPFQAMMEVSLQRTEQRTHSSGVINSVADDDIDSDGDDGW